MDDEITADGNGTIRIDRLYPERRWYFCQAVFHQRFGEIGNFTVHTRTMIF